MQTRFSAAQLADPEIATCESIFRACVHCGFCTATCPTYVTLGDELDSPRGRIYLIKDMLENDRPASARVATHLDRCLSCLSCMTTCPSGVHYMHLVDYARRRVEESYRRPLAERGLRALLARLVPYPGRFRLAMWAGALSRPFAALMPGRLKAAAALAPRRVPAASPLARPQVVAAQGTRRARMALLKGCAQEVLAPEINDATVRLLTRHGVEVVIAEGSGCCGSLSHHMGREAEALALARANVESWSKVLEAGGLDAVVITASGCGTTVKDYGFMFRLDQGLAAKAEAIAAIARDVSEVLDGLEIDFSAEVPPLRVAYHSACSMQHGQRITTLPKALLAKAGFSVADVPEGHLCCGSAGVYNLLQPEIAGRLQARKVANIESVAPEVVATGNIGCMVQIGQATELPVVHTAELLDWASGGPKPGRL